MIDKVLGVHETTYERIINSLILLVGFLFCCGILLFVEVDTKVEVIVSGISCCIATPLMARCYSLIYCY